MKFIIFSFILYVCICLKDNERSKDDIIKQIKSNENKFYGIKPNKKHGMKINEGEKIGGLANKCIKFFRKMGKYFGIICETIGKLIPIHFILNIILNIFSICISYLWLFHGFYLQILESSRPKRIYLGAFVILVGSVASIIIAQIFFKRRKFKKNL